MADVLFFEQSDPGHTPFTKASAVFSGDCLSNYSRGGFDPAGSNNQIPKITILVVGDDRWNPGCRRSSADPLKVVALKRRHAVSQSLAPVNATIRGREHRCRKLEAAAVKSALSKPTYESVLA